MEHSGRSPERAQDCQDVLDAWREYLDAYEIKHIRSEWLITDDFADQDLPEYDFALPLIESVGYPNHSHPGSLLRYSDKSIQVIYRAPGANGLEKLKLTILEHSPDGKFKELSTTNLHKKNGVFTLIEATCDLGYVVSLLHNATNEISAADDES